MLFFRSEEHLENWAQYDAEKKEGVVSLKTLMAMFSTSYFTKRLEPAYVSNMRNYMSEIVEVLSKADDIREFWKLG